MADVDVAESENLLGRTENISKQTNYRRLLKGGIVLVLVDILWVGSAELSDFIFHNQGYDKPFFTTYAKTSAFVIYLPLVWLKLLWSKHFYGNSGKTLTDSDSIDVRTSNNDHVRTYNGADFADNESLYKEVSPDPPSNVKRDTSKQVSTRRIMKIALVFCILWFLATLSYQEALALTSPAAVNILSSSSGLFTLILAAVFQSSQTDRFSYSKLVAVITSIAGIVLVTFSDSHQTEGAVNYGAVCSLAGAILYSCYLVLLKHKVPDEKQMDIGMFFGFVGLFNIFLLWPGFWFLHVTKIERFQLPNDWQVWSSIMLNAVLGTALSEYLWLWGCYLTSSLSATMALGMVMPLTMLTDIIRGRVHLSLMFILGSIPIFLSFFLITYLCHYENWDPVKTCVILLYSRCRRPPSSIN